MQEKRQRRPLVCGTDSSAVAVEAMDVAAAMARRLETKLVLLHVEEYSGMAEVDPGLFEEALSQKRGELEKAAARLRGLGTEVEIKLLSGSVFDELVTAAVDCKGRAMVVGAVGHGLARRLLVGSVAERTAETSPIPTLVVRPGGRLVSWLRGEHPLKILVGYDFSPASDAALRWVNELQQIGPCHTTVLHLDWPPNEADRLGYHGPMPLTRNPTEIQNFLERDLAEHVALRLAPEHVTVTVEPAWGHPAGHLFEVVKRDEIDLIVVGTHHRHGWSRLRFGSVSRSVLHHAEVSVAVVPPLEEHPRRVDAETRARARRDGFLRPGQQCGPVCVRNPAPGWNIENPPRDGTSRRPRKKTNRGPTRTIRSCALNCVRSSRRRCAIAFASRRKSSRTRRRRRRSGKRRNDSTPT